MPACRACTQVWCHEIGGARMFHGVAIKQRYPGHAVQAGHIAAQCGASAYASKYIVVVDDDVDVTNLDHLLWAMLTRTDPKESIQFIEGSWDSPADPRLPPEKRAKGDMTHSVAIIDACRPWSLARQVSADQHAERRGDAQGAGEIRLAAGPCPVIPDARREAIDEAAESGTSKSNGYADFVYLLASQRNGTLYLGVTRDLVRRVYQHEQRKHPGLRHTMEFSASSGSKYTTIQPTPSHASKGIKDNGGGRGSCG